MASVKLEALPVVTISNGGTAVPLKSTTLPISSCIIQAEYTNTGRVVIGDANVTTSTGLEIGPGDTITLSLETLGRVSEFDLADIYVNSSTSGNKVRVIVFRRP